MAVSALRRSILVALADAITTLTICVEHGSAPYVLPALSVMTLDPVAQMSWYGVSQTLCRKSGQIVNITFLFVLFGRVSSLWMNMYLIMSVQQSSLQRGYLSRGQGEATMHHIHR